MARKFHKAKEPVRLRFKALADGGKSIYLDIYTKGARRYDFLRLYLVPERTPADRLQNEQTMRAANAIKAQRIIEITNSTAGIASKQGGKVLLTDWVLNFPRTQAQNETKLAYRSASVMLKRFAPAARLKDIDRNFCLQYMRFLVHEYKTRAGKPLALSTAQLHYARFVTAMNAAVRCGLIAQNPCALISTNEKIKAPAAQRCYLTKEELQRLIDAEPQSKAAANTKQAFLFACFCGLRISDIRALKWGDISTSAEGLTRIEIRMQKTQELLYIPLSRQALAYLPARTAADPETKVFTNLSTSIRINTHIQRLAAAAGISKHVTFHSARHTFATLLLTEGADLYTTSKLLKYKYYAGICKNSR